MRARGKERRETIWFRDADVAEAIDAALFVGLADWYPPNYDCGACGYATCAEFLHATAQLRQDSDELEFVGPQCNLREIDLGIAVGSAAKTGAIHSIDCRCQTRLAVAARKRGIIHADVAVALSLSLTHRAVGFDRRVALAGRRDNIATELHRECLGHVDHPSSEDKSSQVRSQPNQGQSRWTRTRREIDQHRVADGDTALLKSSS